MPAVRRTARLATALAVGGLLLATADAGAAPGALGARATEQVDALQDLKRSALAGPERKLDSRLLVAVEQQAGRLRALPKLDAGVDVGAAGLTEVDIRAAASPALLERLAQAGAQVRYASARSGAIRARVPLAALERIAGWAAVRRITTAAQAMTSGLVPTRAGAEGGEGGAAGPRAVRRAGGAVAGRDRLRGRQGARRRRRPRADPRDRGGDEALRALGRRRLARRLGGRRRAAARRRPAGRGGRGRRGHGDAGDPPRRRARARSSASPPRSRATRRSPTTSARCASRPAAT